MRNPEIFDFLRVHHNWLTIKIQLTTDKGQRILHVKLN